MSHRLLRMGVLGGGICGLSLAYFLQEFLGGRARITVFEASDRPGGWIESRRRNGFIFEQGPRSFPKSAGQAVIGLAKKLGIEDELIISDDNARHRFLYLNGGLVRLPSGMADLFSSSIGWRMLIAALREPFKKRSAGDMSVHRFFLERFSPFVADVLADAMVNGIYAGDSRALSMRSCFPKTFSWYEDAGSVVWGGLREKSAKDPSAGRSASSLLSFAGGMEMLVEALVENLVDGVLCSHKVSRITEGHEGISVRCDEQEYEFDHLFSCLPAHALSPILPDHGELSTLLSKLKSTSVAVVGMAFAKGYAKTGFGYLIPSGEKEDNLGVVWDSSAFSHVAPKGLGLITVMIGGERFLDFDQLSEAELVALAKGCLARQMGMREGPSMVEVKIAHNAIPQYLVGHGEVVEGIEKLCGPRLSILGSSFYGVSVNDCIKRSEEVAEGFFKRYRCS